MKQTALCQSRRFALLLAMIWALAGCANIYEIKPGTPVNALMQQFGRPSSIRQLPDGAEQLEYNTAPFGQQTTMVVVRDGAVVSAKQVLTAEEFATVRIGTDTRESIRQHFGEPSEVIYLRLSARDVWSYRLVIDTANSMMHLQFDRGGVLREAFAGPDMLRDPPDPGR